MEICAFKVPWYFWASDAHFDIGSNSIIIVTCVKQEVLQISDITSLLPWDTKECW